VNAGHNQFRQLKAKRKIIVWAIGHIKHGGGGTQKKRLDITRLNLSLKKIAKKKHWEEKTQDVSSGLLRENLDMERESRGRRGKESLLFACLGNHLWKRNPSGGEKKRGKESG